MNLIASFRRGPARTTNVFAAAFGLATLFAAQSPLSVSAADAIALGSNVTFVASADGSPAPTFQWRKNGTAISGATSQNFSLSSVTAADAATYQVVATNEAGFAVSPDEVLVVDTLSTNTAPVIVTQPTPSLTALAGTSITLSVSATGTPTPTFQWQKNGVSLAGATGASLQLVALTTNDNASYTALASNIAGTVGSNPAVLVVTTLTTNPPSVTNVAPTILTQPSDSQTASLGGSASFTVSASGVPAPTYQWKKNGVAISGATDATFAISFLTATDSASYVAVASNIAGTVTSNPAVLKVSDVAAPPPPPTSLVNASPVITSQPSSTQTVTAGSSVSFVVVATGSPAPSFQWRKNGAKIAGATNATFALSSATSADAAAYSVIASNSAGAVVSENSVLLVYSTPRFTVQPTTQAVIIGTSTKFSVAVSAIPGAILQWRKDGVPIAGATSSLLLVNSASASDLGTYSVVAKNDLGTATSDEAALVIAAPPIITLQPVAQTVAAKSNVTLSAAASGAPAPTFQWKKNGSAISGATAATLVIKAVNKADAAEYSVDARNVAGWVTSKRAMLVVTTQAGRLPNEEDNIEVTLGDEGLASSGLVNLSVRANAGSGSDGLIVGFVIDGQSSKSVLIRGVGPSLRNFGVVGALADPQLSLYSGSVITASNDDWSANENAAQIAGTGVRVGAFSLADQTSDSALMATLNNGAYTVQLSGKEASSGVALVELYDAGSSGTGKLVNLSVRAYIGTGSEVPNVGFVVAGTTSRTVMIRAVGPALGAFGVSNSISDPQLELFSGSTRLNQNDNWGGSAALSATFVQVGAFGFGDASSRDAVLLTTLAPGAYTVVVSGVNGASGVGLVEVYDIP